MGKWTKTLVVGFVIFAVLTGCLFLFSMLMAQQVVRWQEAGAALSTVQILGVRFAFLFMRQWFTLVPLLFLVCVGIPLLIAAVKK